MTTTPQHPADENHPQAQPTQPIPPIGATQPLPAAPATPATDAAPAAGHPTNPFTPPHPAAPGEVHAEAERARQDAAAQRAAQQASVRAQAERDAAYRAQWTAAQQAAAQHAAAQSFAQPAAHQPPALQPAAHPPGPYATAAHPASAQQHAAPGPYGPVRPVAAAGVPPYGPTATQPGGSGPRRRRTWVPVVSAAAAAAILGAAATVGVAHAIGDDDASGSRPASLATIGRDATDTVPVAGSTNEDPDWQAVAQAVAPSVVAIEVSTGQGGAQGSGVIVDEQGHVVTNNHVVAGAQDGKVQVTLTDGRLFEATVVGLDPTSDLAVVKLDDAPDDLAPAALGDSAKVVVGQAVMAVGNPLGLANTVTTGIVSAVDRPVSTSSEDGSQATVTNAIQIDAAVNPGNSGGPLFDAQGRVIGINSSIATMSQASGSIGLGFAIPSDLVKNIAAQLIEDGTAEHAFLGVSLSDGTATADGVTRRGAVVEEVSQDSPASKAGLQAQDVVVAIDGKAVGGAESLTAYVRALTSGAEATLTVVRDGKATEVDVTLATRTETAPSTEGNQGQGDQGQGEQGDQGQQGPGDLPGGMTPEDLWKWFQEQGQG
ncbi:S1C family serine protease [Cellulomonas biazotea]|uniref:S1C family serine protease n=2 Tax=Cellulomonas biazotea TaxID=1709 RepID=UPI0035E48A46